MGNMYNRIVELCEQKGIKPGRVCADTGLSRGMMSDLKMGRTKALSAKNTKIIADYFGVSTDYLLTGKPDAPLTTADLGHGEIKTPAPAGERVSDDDIKFALFGGAEEITDEMYEEVKRFAQFIQQRERDKNK